MQICESMDIMDKLAILTDAAKYDVACTSSGTERKNNGKGIGNTARSGICHSFLIRFNSSSENAFERYDVLSHVLNSLTSHEESTSSFI